MSDPDYYAPATAMDYAAVGLYSVALVATGGALIGGVAFIACAALLARMNPAEGVSAASLAPFGHSAQLAGGSGRSGVSPSSAMAFATSAAPYCSQSWRPCSDATVTFSASTSK